MPLWFSGAPGPAGAAVLVTIRQPLGIEVVVARAQITRMQASKLSLMPEGLEEELTNQDLADLVDFIFADSR